MTSRTFLTSDGNDRLVVTTICTHLVFFHEAGFEYRTERKQRTPFVWWNPTTWHGFKWSPSDDAEQPRDIRCTFNQGADPMEFGATPQTRPGFFKSSCEQLSIRRHCVWVAVGDTPLSSPGPAVSDDARSIRDVLLQFNYDGQMRKLRHSTGGEF